MPFTMSTNFERVLLVIGSTVSCCRSCLIIHTAAISKVCCIKESTCARLIARNSLNDQYLGLERQSNLVQALATECHQEVFASPSPNCSSATATRPQRCNRVELQVLGPGRNGKRSIESYPPTP